MIITQQKWINLVNQRACDSCHACCIWTGVEELQKWTGERCKHLDTRCKTKHCSVYADKPNSCSTYKCMWLQGFGPASLRPNVCGMVMSAYTPEEHDEGIPAVTLLVFDEKKARRTLVDTVIQQILQFFPGGVNLRVVWPKREKVMYFSKGEIYDCKLLPSNSWESLSFEATSNQPIARYKIVDAKEVGVA